MSRWLKKASRVIGRRAGKADQSFQIQCRCGRLFNGWRRSTHQRIICGDCGYALFVLPRNVYPEIAVPRTPRPKRAPAAPRVPITQKARELTHAQRQRLLHARARLATATGEAIQSLKSTPRSFRSLFTPFRLVLLSMACVISATGYGLWYWNSLEQAEATLKSAVEKGRVALHNGDFRVAENELTSADKALNKLGQNDAYSRGVRQMLRESVAAGNLLTMPLPDLLAAASEALTNGRLEDWGNHFEATDRDAWIVVDAPVAPADQAPQAHGASVDFPLLVAGVSVDVKFDAEFGPASLRNESRRMIFAAQLRDCQPPRADRESWVVHLRSDTAFLWCGVESCQALGFEADDETRELLNQQTKAIGLEK